MKHLICIILYAGLLGGCTFQYTQHNSPPDECDYILVGGAGHCEDDDCLCPTGCDEYSDSDCWWAMEWYPEG